MDITRNILHHLGESCSLRDSLHNSQILRASHTLARPSGSPSANVPYEGKLLRCISPPREISAWREEPVLWQLLFLGSITFPLIRDVAVKIRARPSKPDGRRKVRPPCQRAMSRQSTRHQQPRRQNNNKTAAQVSNPTRRRFFRSR